MKTRQSIGAIIFKEDKFLLLCRGMILTTEGFKNITPEWDLLKGGIDEGESPKEALLRELYEESGSKKYVIIKQFKDKLKHGLPLTTGFNKQETVVFLVQYLGDGTDLKPDKKEIIKVQFFDKTEAYEKIRWPETKEFFKKHI